jgi:hypothetical protein
MGFTFSIDYGRKYVIFIDLRIKGGPTVHIKGKNSCHMYNYRSRKSGNGLKLI